MPLRLYLRAPLTVVLSALLMGLPALTHAADADAPDVSVDMRRVDGHPQFDVRAGAVASTSLANAWRVLTGYGRLAEFVPNLTSSVELPLADAAPGEHLVEQHGYGKFLFIRQAIDLVLRVQEQPMRSIDMTLQSGNMRQYHARWELREVPPGEEASPAQGSASGPRVQLRYVGRIAPDFYVPGLFGSSLMRRDLSNMLTAVVRQMERAPADATAP